MAFDWNQYQAFAKSLEQTASTECDYRVAVTRSYYAAYNICRVTLQTIDTSFRPQGDSHQELINRYINSQREAKAIGNMLNTIRLKRVDADYKGNAEVKKSDMSLVIQTVDRIFGKIEEAKNNLS